MDIRGDDQRRSDGLIPGAIQMPRNSLEWRCDPASEWRHPAITTWEQRLILICNEGCQSSLAAAVLIAMGLRHATDMEGGFVAWRAAGLPVVQGLGEAPTRSRAPSNTRHHTRLEDRRRNG